MRPTPAERLPTRNLPPLYLGFAYLCLATAFLVLAISPQSVAGFFYHPKMLAVVHLVTLGWVTSSILGMFYLIGPVALRATLHARRSDYLACLLVTVGILGMVAHFWIDAYDGMVWAAGTLLVGIVAVAWRGIRAVFRAPISGAVKLHVSLAFTNIVGAGTLGMLIGLEKQMVHVLPGHVLHNVYAHAHLAALGWATMMVMGTAYRLFPMVLPASMPKNIGTWMSATLVEAGLLGLLVALPAGWKAARYASVALILCGLAAFFSQVAWMMRNAKPSPKGLVRPDFGTLHAMQGVLYLALAAALGVVLAVAPEAPWKIRAIMAYGVFGLLGFLAQMVIGISARILPMFAWMHLFAGSDFKTVPPSLYAMHYRGLQITGFVLWTAGVPMLAYGLALDVLPAVSLAAWGLFLALVCNAVNTVLVLRHAFAG